MAKHGLSSTCSDAPDRESGRQIPRAWWVPRLKFRIVSTPNQKLHNDGLTMANCFRVTLLPYPLLHFSLCGRLRSREKGSSNQPPPPHRISPPPSIVSHGRSRPQPDVCREYGVGSGPRGAGARPAHGGGRPGTSSAEGLAVRLPPSGKLFTPREVGGRGGGREELSGDPVRPKLSPLEVVWGAVSDRSCQKPTSRREDIGRGRGDPHLLGRVWIYPGRLTGGPWGRPASMVRRRPPPLACPLPPPPR